MQEIQEKNEKKIYKDFKETLEGGKEEGRDDAGGDAGDREGDNEEVLGTGERGKRVRE